MNESALRERLTARMGIDNITDLCLEVWKSGSIEKLCSFLFCDDSVVGRNAAWTLTHFDGAELAMLAYRQNAMIDFVLITKDTSLRRLLLTILNNMEFDKEEIRTDFLDYCLENMISMEQTPGVQALCMKIAYRLCSFYPELTEEFLRTVKGMEISYYTPALKSVRNNILHKKC